MRHVEHDSVLVRLGNHQLAERGESVPLPDTVGFAGVAVGELAVPVVREGEIARPLIVEPLDVGNVLADPVAVLDAHQGDFLAALDNAADVGGGVGDFDAVRRQLFGEPMHGGELLQVGVERLFVAGWREVWVLPDINREENRVESAVLHLRDIHL